MRSLNTLVRWLDRELRVREYRDASHNGLQVANDGKVARIGLGVDANLELFRKAAERGVSLLICHHGLSWGDSMARLTGAQYRRVAFLVKNNIALYAAHLPLDAHPRWGHNAVLARELGLMALRPMGHYHGTMIGWRGRLRKPLPAQDFIRKVEAIVGGPVRTLAYGPALVRTVGVVSGAAGELAEEAAREGLDAFITGEPSLQARTPAQEYGMHVLFAGHYRTELFGLRALAQALQQRFRIPCEVFDFGVEL